MGNILGAYSIDTIHPGFSIDCVILSFHKGKLKILLSKFFIENYWALPGGFMFKHEDSDQAAYRILKERTGLTNIFLKQFHLFSSLQRTIKEQNLEIMASNSLNEDAKWFLNRFVSLGYYALVKFDSIKLTKADSANVQWYNIDDLPQQIYSDHRDIIDTSLKTIRTVLSPIQFSYELLPEKFTITELRKIHEIILEKTLDRRNFQRKILSEGYVIQLDEKKEIKAYNPPILYSINFSGKDAFGNALITK